MVYLSQKRLIVSKLKPRKGKDIKWIMIENIYNLFWEIFWDENTLYVVCDMFSISIHLISLSFRGFNCDAISLFWGFYFLVFD
jgi:hypothetical protein